MAVSSQCCLTRLPFSGSVFLFVTRGFQPYIFSDHYLLPVYFKIGKASKKLMDTTVDRKWLRTKWRKKLGVWSTSSMLFRNAMPDDRRALGNSPTTWYRLWHCYPSLQCSRYSWSLWGRTTSRRQVFNAPKRLHKVYGSEARIFLEQLLIKKTLEYVSATFSIIFYSIPVRPGCGTAGLWY